MTTDSASYLTKLHELINGHFNLAEIQTLCFKLSVDYESIPGEEKPSRIRELLLALGRNGRLSELIILLQQERPHVEWLLVPDDFQLPKSLAKETAVAANQYHVYGDVVQGDKYVGDKVDGDKIVVGNISNSTVAIGRGASVHIGDVINYYVTRTYAYPYENTIGIQRFFTNYLGTEDKPAPFGGRDCQFAQLNEWLIETTTQRLLLVAPAGRGKSALLAHWSQQFADEDKESNLAVIFVPISLRFNTNQKESTFATLATRLAHFYGEQPPTTMSPQLSRELVVDYLRKTLPNGRQLLLILDGLDEAAWDVSTDLLPQNLPATTRVIVSARYLGGEKQSPAPRLRRLGWDSLPPEQVQAIELKKLTLAGVQDVLQKMGYPLDQSGQNINVAQELYRLSKGDPLLVELYIKALWPQEEGALPLPPEELQNIQPGYKEYFKSWWEEQKRLWDDKNPWQEPLVRAILNLLALAYGSLLKEDIQKLLPEEIIDDSLLINEAITSLSRFVIGDGQEQGYVFSHPKLADYFGEQLTRRDKAIWKARFLAWGEQTLADLQEKQLQPHDVSRYVMLHYAQHLEKDLPDDCQISPYTLINKIWMNTHYEYFGNYENFLSDVDCALNVATKNKDIAIQIKGLMCHASINSLSSDLSPHLPAEVTSNSWRCSSINMILLT